MVIVEVQGALNKEGNVLLPIMGNSCWYLVLKLQKILKGYRSLPWR